MSRGQLVRLFVALPLLLVVALACSRHEEHGSAPWKVGAQKRTALQYMVRQIHKGHPRRALAVSERSLEQGLDAPSEAYFVKALALANLGRIEEAAAAAHAAIDAGLPPGRFLAGPRGIAKPLVEAAAFRELIGADSVQLVHGPMLGAVTPTSARVWVRTARAASVQVEARESPGDGAPIASSTARSRGSNDYSAVVELTGLRPRQRYSYRVLVDGQPVEIEPEPAFVTSPEPADRARFQVAFGACSNFDPRSERTWEKIWNHHPLAFLGLGDNVYSNLPGLINQRYFYYQRHSSPPWRLLAAHVPIYLIWDDHDFGGDDRWGGPEVDQPPWKRKVIYRVFHENTANPGYGDGAAHPGCWYRFSIGDVDFLMLDGRYYRTDPRVWPRSMLGPVQKEWLFRQLLQSKATFKVIVSPVPMATGTKPGSRDVDTWDGFPEEREEILSLIGREHIEGVFLLAGDRHRSDAWKISRPDAYDLYEAETAQLTRRASAPAMPEAIFSLVAGGPKFGLLTFDLQKPDPEIVYEVVNLKGRTVASLVVKHSQLSFPE